MNFGTLKAYNKTGTLVCDLDQSYNEYRDLAHQLANKWPDDVKQKNYYQALFDGCNIDNTSLVMRPKLMAGGTPTDIESSGVPNH